MTADLREVRRSAPDDDEPIEALLPARHIVAVIGIDAYASLPRLRCAVSDALGVVKLLTSIGFEMPIPPLLDGAATKPAIESLVEDQLRAVLRPDDALVLFFAGHGTTRVAQIDQVTVETGYLIPVEARSGEHFADLLRMEDLLGKLALLPARHILVVLDTCHSGMALGPAMVGYRGSENSLRAVLGKRSRRVITSARRDEPALDTGPVPGHSLFTGALIQSIACGSADIDGNGFITLTELAVRLQQVVGQASGSRQTPDYGAFHLDDRGELVFAAKGSSPVVSPTPAPSPPAARRAPAALSRTSRILAGGAAALLAAAGALAVKAWLPGDDAVTGEYTCRVGEGGEDVMKSCRVAVSADGVRRVRFEAPAIDAILLYDGPLASRGGRWVVPLDVWFRGGPSLEQRGRAGELVLLPSPDGGRRGDWVLPDGRAVPFVLTPVSGVSALPSAAGPPSGAASVLPSLDDVRTTKRRALGVPSSFESARELLSPESYLGRANEIGVPGVLCRSYASIMGVVGRALTSGGYRRDHDGTGRNYERMTKGGFGVPVWDVSLAFAGEVPVSPEDEVMAAADARTMDEEEAADRHAAEMVRRFVDRAVESGETLEDVLGEHTFNTLSNMALYLWYRSLAPVLLPTCADLAEKRFFVTRCMCRDRTSYMRAQQSFSSTHPPIYLRMFGVMGAILREGDIERLQPKARDLMAARTVMMYNLLSTNAPFAGGACVLQRKDSKALEGLKRIYITYPGLEGVYSEPRRTDSRLGWPVDSEMADLERACTAGWPRPAGSASTVRF